MASRLKLLCVAAASVLCSSVATTLALDCNYYTATPAYCDPLVCNTGGGHALYLNGDLNGDSQFIFTPGEEGLLTAPGTSLVSLEGNLVPKEFTNAPFNSYKVQLILEKTAGLGMSSLIDPSAVNMTSWEYYRLVSGFVTRTAGRAVTYPITQQMEDMPMQIGYGANSKNLGFGASVWINIVVGDRRVAGDFDLDLNCTAPSSSSSSEECPVAPFFSVNYDHIYVCYTATPDSLDANILFQDGYTFNWHPWPVFPTADHCYMINLPSGHGRIVWVQVHGFNCHYGENNIGREQNCGVELCHNNNGPSSSSSVEASSSSSQESSSSAPSSSSSVESSSSSVEPSSSQESSSAAPPASSSQEESSSSIDVPPPAGSSSSQEPPASSSSSGAPICEDTCPAAPFFTVNGTQIFACFTTLPDTDMDANIRYEDGTIFNWHPYDYQLDENNCLSFFVPNDNDHGAIVWAQVNGFDCHYGEDNSGREQNCGWNLCQSCGDSGPVTSGLPDGVPPYTPIDGGNNGNNNNNK